MFRIASVVGGMLRLKGFNLANWGTLFLLTPPLIFLSLLFAAPLFQVIWTSFFAPDFTLQYYERIGQNPIYGHIFWNTAKVSALTTISCLILGYPTAYFLSTLRSTTRQLLLVFVVLPFLLSILIRNYAWILLLQTNGGVNRILLSLGLISKPLELMYNETGVLIGMTNVLLPYMIFPLLSAFMAIPSDVKEASASLGANSTKTFLRVTLPMSLPGISAGCLLVFIVSLGYFVTPALLGGPRQMMISNIIEFHVRQVLNWPFAFALANVLLMGTLIWYFLYIKIIPKQRS
jgi:ABC-type spermidine/putrescine transport system permease subunit I